MSRRFTRAAGLVAATLLLVLTAPVVRAADPPDARPLRLSVFGDPHTLLPILATNKDESDIAGLIFDPLIDFDADNRPVPVLLTTVPNPANGGISADGRTIVMHLRHDVRWQDGAAFTARDVLFTFRTILDERNTVANRADYANIARTDAPDPATVIVHLKAPQSSFLSNVAGGYDIIPEHLLARSANLATDPFNAHPVGTGAYTFVRWQRGDRVELAANPHYFRGVPKIARVTIAVVPDVNTLAIQLRQHEVDFAAVESSVYNQLRDTPGILRSTAPNNDFVAIAMNAKRPLLADAAVRHAIVRAIDRTRIVQNVTFGTGTPAYADLPFFMYGGHAAPGWDAADPAAARGLLERAGWKAGPDGIRLRDGVPLRLQYIDYSGSVSGSSIDVQVIQMLRDVGIDVTYKTYAPALYFQPAAQGGALMGGDYDLAAIGISGGNDTTNSAIYGCSSRIPNGFNAANYCSPAMERLQAQALREYDPVKRDRITAQIEDLAVADATYAFLYHTPWRFIANTALQRPVPGLSSPWYDLYRWTLTPPR